MKDSPQVRQATAADRAVLEQFMAALQDLERELDGNRRPGAEMAGEHVDLLLDWAASDPTGGCLIAEIAREPAAFIIFGMAEAWGANVPERTRRHGVIAHVWVEPDYRGRGLVSLLIGAVEDHMRAHGVTRLEIGVVRRNREALRLYRSLGYDETLVTLARDLG